MIVVKIHVLDTRQLGHPGIVAATALETDDGLALFDTGPESTFDNVIGDLRKAGFEAKDVRHVFLSHIHFDHAGAAWRFANEGAKIYVHPRGAAHLIDPAKLVESATRIFGDDMDRLWGKIAPVPAERVKTEVDRAYQALHDGEIDFIGGAAHGALAAFPGWRGVKLLGALAQGMYWFLVMGADSAVRSAGTAR